MEGNTNFGDENPHRLVGQRLRIALVFSGKNLSQLANLIERSERQMLRYLDGEHRIPSEIIRRLAKALGVSESFLLHGKPAIGTDIDIIKRLFPSIMSVSDGRMSALDIFTTISDKNKVVTEINEEYLYNEHGKRVAKILKIGMNIFVPFD